MRLSIRSFVFVIASIVCVCKAEFTDFYWNSEHVDTPQSKRVTRGVSDRVYEERSNCLGGNSSSLHGGIDTTLRVNNLREALTLHSLKAIIVPSTDQHQNEYVAPSDKRLEFIAGFSGSAGIAIVTTNHQVLFTDTRYPLQADKQLDCHWKIIIYGGSNPSPSKWLADNLSAGDKVAADDRLFGSEKWTSMQKKLNDSQIDLVSSGNLFDAVWEAIGRPIARSEPLFIHEIKYAGKTWQMKMSEIRWELREKEVDLFIVTSLDEVAWLFNLRGNDFPYTPVFYSYAAIEAADNGTAWLFVRNPGNLKAKVIRHLSDESCDNSSYNCIEISSYDKIGEFIQNSTKNPEVRKVLLSKAHPYSQGASQYIHSAVPEDKRELDVSPILLAKAKKNSAEVEALKTTHLEDSASLVEFLAFMEDEVTRGSRIWNEYSASEQLTKVRAQNKNFKGNSFEAISAFGTNGAIVHYTPDAETAKVITNESLYLLDSGGQYLGGTTDVTRTMHYGSPTPFQIECYTRVLKGVLDVAMLVFPDQTRENLIDILARRPLFERGLTYGHGSGHGIGIFLQVHEGPTLLSSSKKYTSPIEMNYFFSDEPGYYQPNEFGIRIENVVRTTNATNLSSKSTTKMLSLETVTLVPYEPKLIDPTLLTPMQCKNINDYHQEIRQKVGPILKDKKSALDWMLRKTQPILCTCGGQDTSPPRAN